MENEKFSQLFVEVAVEAGCLIMSHYGKKYEVSRKKDDSPVTQVDKLAEELILSRLYGKLQDLPVISEEDVEANGVRSMENSYVLIDPIDGTKEFIDQNGEFTVNIALIDKGFPVCGVVYAPCKGTIYWSDGNQSYRARVDGEALKDTSRITVRKEPKNGPTVLASRSHLNDETRCLVEQLPVNKLNYCGSSWKFCLIAEGRGDIYPRLSRTFLWDIAAGDAVLRGAGGTVVSLTGRELDYSLPKKPTLKHLASSSFLAVGDKKVILRYLDMIKSCVNKNDSQVQAH